MFTIQYKVSTNIQNLNSKSGIRKPWAENPYHGLKIVCWKIVETHGSMLRIRFWCAPKPTGGDLAGYPPPVHQGRGQSPCKEYNTYPTFSHLLFSLHTRRNNFFSYQQFGAEMPIAALHQENFSMLTNFVNESTTLSKVSIFSSNTFILSTMSLTK